MLRASEILAQHGKAPSTQLNTRTVRQIVEEISAHMGVLTWDVSSSHGAASSSDSALAHDYAEWKNALFAHVCSKLMQCLEHAEILLGDVRKRQEEEAHARIRKEAEEHEEIQKRQQQERAKAAELKLQQMELERQQKEQEKRKLEEDAVIRQKEEEIRLQVTFRYHLCLRSW